MHTISVIDFSLKLFAVTGVWPVKSNVFSSALKVFYVVALIVSCAINFLNYFYIDNLNAQINNIEGLVSITDVSNAQKMLFTEMSLYLFHRAFEY